MWSIPCCVGSSVEVAHSQSALAEYNHVCLKTTSLMRYIKGPWVVNVPISTGTNVHVLFVASLSANSIQVPKHNNNGFAEGTFSFFCNSLSLIHWKRSKFVALLYLLLAWHYSKHTCMYTISCSLLEYINLYTCIYMCCILTLKTYH